MSQKPVLELRPFQTKGIEIGEEFLTTAPRGAKKLLVAPTGSGKSPILIGLRRPGRYLVAPSLEIIDGICAKIGIPASQAESAGIWTPIRLRNELSRGAIESPTGLILDEAHHDESDSWQEFGVLGGDPPSIGLTATPYRGSPRSSVRFRERWGEPTILLTLRESVENGYSAMPRCSVEPLLDDDIIKVSSTGEFEVASANEAIGSRVGDACELIRRFHDGEKFDKPTMLALPSTECVGYFAERLGVLARPVVGDTSREDRLSAFSECVSRRAILLQIKVVSEGVDLPIRRLIDLSPTLSPVRWLQQFGRITRPGGESEYICCCRNLFRHCYLLDGLVPVALIAQEAQLFGNVSSRNAGRTVGLEAVGRFKSAEIPFNNGLTGSLYALSAVEGGVVTEYAILTHPLYPRAVCARRIRNAGTFGSKWELLPGVPIIDKGYSSVPGSAITEKQKAWWERDAEKYGLDPTAKITRKNFVALPVLAAIRMRFK